MNSLPTSAIWPATVIVLAVIGAVTWLATDGVLAGGDVLTVVMAVLVGVLGITTAHVTAQAVTASSRPPPPTAEPAPPLK